MAVRLCRGVDLRRKTPKREKPRTPDSSCEPVDLTRKVPKKVKNTRRKFIDQEDLSFATLVGPSALRRIIIDAGKEIDEINHEIEAIYEKYIPEGSSAWEYRIGTFWECDSSPFGLCMYHQMFDPCWDNCIFCGEPHERK